MGGMGGVAGVGTSHDSIARYFADASSTTIAKTHVAFKAIAKNCESKVLEIRYPMFAMFKDEGAGAGGANAGPSRDASGRKQLAKITLQVLRLPPIPGLKPEDMPACIDDCLRGIRHHAWHENEYHEGTLTQEGGDCKVGLDGGLVSFLIFTLTIFFSDLVLIWASSVDSAASADV
jgi:serine/arginine repetitive matrix protein 2